MNARLPPGPLPLLQIVQSHSVLSLWGSHARLLVLDADEFLAPATPRLSLPQMLAPGGCLAEQRPECLMFFRQDIHTAERPLDKPSAEPGWWFGGAQASPLPRYKYASQHPRLPKVMVDPNHVLPLMVHYTAICNGQSEPAGGASNGTLRSACDALVPCTWVPQDCATMYHVSPSAPSVDGAPAGCSRVPVAPPAFRATTLSSTPLFSLVCQCRCPTCTPAARSPSTQRPSTLLTGSGC